MVDYYAEFGLDKNDSCEELCAKLFKEKKKWITRQNANSIEKRQEAERKVVAVEEAYKIFHDKLKREKYDIDLMKFLKKNGGSQQSQAQPQPTYQQSRQQADRLSIEEIEALAIDNYNNGKSEDNIKLCGNAISQGIVSEKILNGLGLGYWEANNFQEAFNVFERGMREYSNNDSFYINMASLLLSYSVNLDYAKKCIDRALEIDPNEVLALYTELRWLLITGRVDEAEQKISAHIRDYPSDQEYKKWAAEAYSAYSNMFLSEAPNGSTFIPTKEAYESMLYYRKKAHELFPCEVAKDNLDRTVKLGKRIFSKETVTVVAVLAIIGILMISYGGIYYLLAAAVLAYFGFVPEWKADAMEASGKRNIPNVICHGIYSVTSVIIRIYLKILRFIVALFFGI